MRIIRRFISIVDGCQLLLLLVLFTPICQGQDKTNLPKDNLKDPKTSPATHLKLTKTQATNRYANIHCGLMDKAGNLWFGTTGEGVYRYDGKFFTQFVQQDGLCSNTVWSILEDKAGTIWFGTDAGLCRYNGKTITRISLTVTSSRFLLTAISPMSRSTVQNAVWSMMQDRSGKLWFGTSEGVYCYDGVH